MDKVQLPLRGDFQRVNAALALATVDALAKTLPITEKAIVDGLARVRWPGRMQLVQREAGRFILLDGAHNPAGAEALRCETQKQFLGVKPTVILGILADKDWQRIGAELAPMAGRLLLTPVKSERTLAPELLWPVCQQANPQALIAISSCLAAALKQAEADRFVIVTGSLYLVGEAMELLGLSPAPAANERGLNEWGKPVNR
jgi:dihydrofolate synthase/folylpolyglutamate synthase